MKQTDLIYTINNDYYIEVRVRNCRNTFRLRLMNKNKERIDEICCMQDEYDESMEYLKNLVK